MSDIVYREGYEDALKDVAELLHNAAKNGYLQHWNYEIVDQLLMLASWETTKQFIQEGPQDAD